MHRYRDVLDRFQLYYERATFDIERHAVMVVGSKGASASTNANNYKIPPHVHLRCHFCNQVIGVPTASKRTGQQPPMGFPATNQAAQKFKLTSCPHCRKPLPKCSICTLPIGINAEFTYLTRHPFADHPNTCPTGTRFKIEHL